MKEFFIKGKQVKPGLTITNGWYTYVITNGYQLKLVSSGNHAKVHMGVREFNVFAINYSLNLYVQFVDNAGGAIAKAFWKKKKKKE